METCTAAGQISTLYCFRPSDIPCLHFWNLICKSSTSSLMILNGRIRTDCHPAPIHGCKWMTWRSVWMLRSQNDIRKGSYACRWPKKMLACYKSSVACNLQPLECRWQSWQELRIIDRCVLQLLLYLWSASWFLTCGVPFTSANAQAWQILCFTDREIYWLYSSRLAAFWKLPALAVCTCFSAAIQQTHGPRACRDVALSTFVPSPPPPPSTFLRQQNNMFLILTVLNILSHWLCSLPSLI